MVQQAEGCWEKINIDRQIFRVYVLMFQKNDIILPQTVPSNVSFVTPNGVWKLMETK